MRFWDSSEIVPLLLTEPDTPRARGWLDDDPDMAIWWATSVECASAIARAERAGRIPPETTEFALARLPRLLGRVREVQPDGGVRDTARRLVRVHPLRGADALQLAAALAAAQGRLPDLPFVALDSRLRSAASKEGFRVIP